MTIEVADIHQCVTDTSDLGKGWVIIRAAILGLAIVAAAVAHLLRINIRVRIFRTAKPHGARRIAESSEGTAAGSVWCFPRPIGNPRNQAIFVVKVSDALV